MSNDADDRDRIDDCSALIDWLKPQPPDVRFAVATHLNWDNAGPVLDWIVSQPECDATNAAFVFWLTSPDYYVSKFDDPATRSGEGWELFEKILGNWKIGFYRRGELKMPDEGVFNVMHAYRDAVSKRPGRLDPFDVPVSLFGPFGTRTWAVPADRTPERNQELWDMLYRLGTWPCPRPHRPGLQWLSRLGIRAREPGN